MYTRGSYVLTLLGSELYVSTYVSTYVGRAIVVVNVSFQSHIVTVTEFTITAQVEETVRLYFI